MGVAARAGHLRTRPGPSDPLIRKARVCYDHLAGEMGVALYDGLLVKRCLAISGDVLRLTRKGEELMREFGIDLEALRDASPPAVQRLSGLEHAAQPSGGQPRRRIAGPLL